MTKKFFLYQKNKDNICPIPSIVVEFTPNRETKAKSLKIFQINSQVFGLRYCLGCRKRLVSPIYNFFLYFLLDRIFSVRQKQNLFFEKKMNFFRRQEISFVNFDFKNECQNEYEDNKEKLCSRFKNRVPLKIDFKADWTHESNPTAWELNH